MLGWSDVEEMSDYGIEIGAHTLSHPDLSELPLAAATEQITNSKFVIQKRIGKDVLFFAYPYGTQTPKVYDIVKNEFHAACSTNMGFVNLNSDIFSLPRIDMYYFSGNDLFRKLGTASFRYYVKYRSILRFLKRLTK